MVGEDDETTAGPKQVDSRGQGLLEGVEFLVHRDPKCLEHPGCGMDAPPSGRSPWRDAFDEPRQLLGRRDRGGSTGLDDRPRDPRGIGLLAEPPEQRGQLARVEGREKLGRGDAATRVEPHVERSTRSDPEAALRVRQLEAGQAEVEQQPVNRAEARLRRDRPQLPEVRLSENEAIAEPSQPAESRYFDIEANKAASMRALGLHLAEQRTSHTSRYQDLEANKARIQRAR